MLNARCAASRYGGCLAYADPSRNLAFAYTPSYIIEGALDPRARNLVDAVHAAIG